MTHTISIDMEDMGLLADAITEVVKTILEDLSMQ